MKDILGEGKGEVISFRRNKKKQRATRKKSEEAGEEEKDGVMRKLNLKTKLKMN